MPNHMYLDNTTADNCQGIVNLFATNFSSVYETAAIICPNFSYPVSVNINSCYITPETVYEKLKSLDANKKAGPNNSSVTDKSC